MKQNYQAMKIFYYDCLQYIYKSSTWRKIKEKDLVDKFAITGFINNTDLNEKVAILATNSELKVK